jgi:hypothetical protein
LDYCFSETKKNVILIVHQKLQNRKNMCESQGYMKCDCGGNCNGDGGALDRIKELEDELATWRSVFPDVAPEQVQPDRSEMRDRINELTKQRDVLARRRGELETQVPKVVKMFRPQGPCRNEYGVLMYQGGNCSACGAVFWATANFCLSCGARFDWSEGGEA